MRSILNVSLPPQKKATIFKRAKKAGKSISAYIVYAVELEQSLISEDELAARAAQAEKDYKHGKTRALKSLSDLLKL